MSFWHSLETPAVDRLEPPDRVLVADEERLDRVARGIRVGRRRQVAIHGPPLGRRRGDRGRRSRRCWESTSDERATVRRAALLHDVGKLGVSSRILDKPGTLTRNEWEVLRCHPRWSMEILTRVRAFQELGRIAGAHHERLDGSGYFAGLTAEELDLPSRILAVADVAEALSAERPYRPALGPDEVLRIMRRDAGRKLDGEAFAALEDVLPARATVALVR